VSVTLYITSISPNHTNNISFLGWILFWFHFFFFDKFSGVYHNGLCVCMLFVGGGRMYRGGRGVLFSPLLLLAAPSHKAPGPWVVYGSRRNFQ